ncbi:MAG: ATP-dependent RNA helicase HrpA [Polyangiaceae bacterium]|nr:ATP-dependent RNA helicase HrpA [Polyangiaceae bacterium]
MSGPSEDQPSTGRAPIRFPSELPISARVNDIIAALDQHQVVIVVGATGSGKTTQLPKVALKMGRGSNQLIGVTQPRRIAATSVATRVASELKCTLGAEVGYQIRFEDRTGPDTWVKFMTDGILLAETQGDPLLRRYDTLIIDEAHERSLTIDFLLGWLKRILPQRPDLKVIVSSATIETERFSQFFNQAPVVQVEGRTFPVEVLYEPPSNELDMPDQVAASVENLTSLDPRGDILVFLPGEREIRETEQALLAKRLRHTTVQPLYSRLSAAEQRRVFENIAGRRIILATNVAETSLTIPGIVYVVDTGVARLSRYEPRTGITRLQVEGISQASADQRKGRCGRIRDGICVRLYDEQSYLARPRFTDPEMKRTGLSGVILRMKSLGLGDVEDFPFLDPPSTRAIAEGYRVLQELGALDDARELTPLGKTLARFPVDPRVGRMILAGAEYGCLAEILIITAALNIQDPRERPRGLEQKADQLHRRFRDEDSDFSGLLRLWSFAQEQRSTSQLRKACKENFLSFLRMREWSEVHQQLTSTVQELRLPTGARHTQGKQAKRNQSNDLTAALHRALLSGLLSRIGHWDPEHRNYFGARQTRFALHPASTLAKKPPAWVMTFELVETTQLFARTCAKVEPEWLAEVGAHLLKRSYSQPHWSEKSARASIKEHATLFGLPVLRDKSVDYASVAPARARQMFLEHALVRGEYRSRGAFQEKNRQLLAEVARLRDKARQSDMLADDEALFDFFERRVGQEVVNGKTFEDWREAAERSDPRILYLSLADVLSNDHRLRPEDFPDTLNFHGVELPATYRFEPGADDDGITLTLPLACLPQLTTGELEWIISGWHEQKVAQLLEELPRTVRRELGVLAELAPQVAARLTPFKGSMLSELSRAVLSLTGVKVPEEVFCPDAIAGYLRFNFRVVDEAGMVLAQSRDAAWLLRKFGPRAREAFREAVDTESWEHSGLTSWDFPDLPEHVIRTVQGTPLRAFPTLVDQQKTVSLTLLESPAAARAAHFAGLRRLLALSTRTQLSALAKRAPPPFTHRKGLLHSKADADAFRDTLLLRVVEEAFQLGQDLPRTKLAFTALVASGSARLVPVFEAWARSIHAVTTELERTVRALDIAAQQPSGTAAVNDVRSQLDQLFPRDLIAHVELQQLDQFPRYLRAVQARLARATTDPRKDASKAAPFAPVFRDFLAKQATAQDQKAVREVRFQLEELRVSIFAPELKPRAPIPLASAALAVAALR